MLVREWSGKTPLRFDAQEGLSPTCHPEDGLAHLFGGLRRGLGAGDASGHRDEHPFAVRTQTGVECGFQVAALSPDARTEEPQSGNGLANFPQGFRLGCTDDQPDVVPNIPLVGESGHMEVEGFVR